MRYLVLFMLLVGIFVVGKRFAHFNFGGKEGQGPVKTETRSSGSFRGVNSMISGDVEISIGEQPGIEVSAQENLLPLLKTEVKHDGLLHIYFDENISSHETIKIRIITPVLEDVTLGGSGSIKVVTPVKSERLKVNLLGSGEISAQQTEIGTLDATLAGSGNIRLGGSSNSLHAEIVGSGDIDAASLTSQHCDANIAGSGSLDCHVDQELKADITGSGDINYSGNASVQSQVVGSGEVQKK